jgi:hypothetical protein
LRRTFLVDINGRGDQLNFNPGKQDSKAEIQRRHETLFSVGERERERERERARSLGVESEMEEDTRSLAVSLFPYQHP